MLNIYRASAGSGKTFRLTQDYIYLLFKSDKERTHRRILAVTFTNKATDEMKTRILKELHALAVGEKSDYRAGLMDTYSMDEQAVNQRARKILITILHDYSSFAISTIDRFFQQVIRSFARDIGVHGGYNLELDNSQTLEQAVDNLFMDLSKEENRQLLQWLTAYAEERVEQSENWNMRGSIEELGLEIFKESYQHKAEDTNRKLHDREFLISYRKSLRKVKDEFEEKVTQKATEALNLIAAHGLTPESFKGGQRSPMRTLLKLQKGPVEVSDTYLALADDVKNCYTKSSANKDTIAQIESLYVSGLQDCLIQLRTLVTVDIVWYNSSIMVLKHLNTLGILSDLAVQIKKLTDEQNTMLISDSNMLLNKIIDNSDTPFVYEKTGVHIDHYMIDEFQDTSMLQWKNFKPLIENSLASDDENGVAEKFNLVVGDVKQSIYRWRNSDWKLLDEKVLTDFRSDQLHEENLDTNWRSDKNIIDFNNSFFRKAANTLQHKLNMVLEPVLPVYPELKSLTTRIEHAYDNLYQNVSPKANQGRVEFRFIDTSESSEKWKELSLQQLPAIVEDLQSRNYEPCDIAILVRKNQEAQEVIQRLLTYKRSKEARPDCSYDVMGTEGLLIGSAASVRFILGIMYLFLDKGNTVQQAIVNYEYLRGKRGLDDNEALNRSFVGTVSEDLAYSILFSTEENQQLEQLQHSSLFNMVEEIINLFGIGEWHHEAVFVQAFQDLVYKFTTGKTADLNSFLTWWEKSGIKQCIATPENRRAMRIMTVHKSKGLESKVVIMPFCDWDLADGKRNVLWCEPPVAPFNQLPLLPVEYSGKMGQSIFASYYFDELMHLYIDSLNVAYVAFTRARHEMICLAPYPTKKLDGYDKINSLSSLLLACCTVPTPSLDKVVISLTDAFNESDRKFNLGDPTYGNSAPQEKAEKSEPLRIYPSVATNDRLRVRHQSLDFLLENQELTDSKLNYGLIMHDILKGITQRSDQANAIAAMVREGRISKSDATVIEAEMAKFWKLPHTEAWFDENVKVLNETTILTPGGGQFRPDRIIIRGNEAVVIDYKFGENEKPAYLKQVKNYMLLIAGMGYVTKGYVCYVTLSKVIEVD